MLFAIEEKVSEEFKPKELPDFYHSTQAMQAALENASNSNSLRVKWIGTSMDSGWAFIRKNIARILEQKGSVKIRLEIFMLAESFQGLSELNKLWPAQVKNNIEDIQKWKEVIEEEYPERVDVQLIKYSCIPYYSGMLVNDSTLFLAFCSWGVTGYNVGTNPYVKYEKEKGQGHEQIKQFIKWSEYYKG